MKKLLLLVCVALLAGCGKKAVSSSSASTSAAMPEGLDQAALDPKVDPCDDFYQFACGGWMANTQIPADRDRYMRSFTVIADRNELVLKEILEQAAESKLPKDTADGQALGDLYSTCIDEPKLETALPVLKQEIEKFSNVKDAKSLSLAVGRLHGGGVHPFFSFGSTQDLKDSTQVIAGFDQGGQGLPERDYYLKTDEKTKKVRDAYAEHIEKMFVLLGKTPAEAKKARETVMTLETKLAQASMSNVERRDPYKIYHRINLEGLRKAAPLFGWQQFFDGMGTQPVEAITVGHIPFAEALNKIVKEGNAAAWRTYLAWTLIRSVTIALPKAFQDETFRYNSVALTGAKEDRARWKKCIGLVDNVLGEAMGRVYVARTFGADGKKLTLAMVESLEKSFERNLDSLKWMDAPTREQALAKVRAMHNKIGYPDVWRDYGALKIDRESLLGNLLRSGAYETQRDLNKIGKPVDRSEWFMTPSTVNAYNEGLLNEIVFPAGILQPPFFNRAATDGVNFGAMGMVVGHEITHGFDDEGRKFDKDGNLKDWWSEASGKAFEEKTACVKKQFDGYIALEDIHVKGDLTLGENVADLGGLKLSHAALVEWQKTHPPTKASRFTPSQQFFLGHAQAWCSLYRPEAARVRAATDSHSPPQYRVNGPLSNLKEFQQAFSCKEGSKMVRPAAERCEVW